MSFMKKILSAVFLLIFFVNVSWTSAAEIWKIPKNPVQLEGIEKQNYIKKKMDATFHNRADEPHPFSNFEVPDGWTYEKTEIDGVKTEIFENPAAKTNRVILQLHGGGYVLPLDNGHRNLGLVYADLIDAGKIFSVDYRIAPKNIYPAALEDAVKVYKEILNRGINPKNIIVTGDSAGGNLALALSLYLKENKISQPSCLILVSPWTTVDPKALSLKNNENRDLILGKGTPLFESVKNPPYAKGYKKNNPSLSPIYADLKNLPPMLIQAGGYELFLDECVALAKKAAADDVKVTLTIYPGMSHDFALLLPDLKDSADSFKEIKNFVEENL